jgi:hypothetical protein
VLHDPPDSRVLRPPEWRPLQAELAVDPKEVFFMKRKILSVIFVLLVLATPALASYSPRAMLWDGISLFINGKEVESDIPPMMADGRVMVPLRVIGENLGAAVEWDFLHKRVDVFTKSGTSSHTQVSPPSPQTRSSLVVPKARKQVAEIGIEGPEDMVAPTRKSLSLIETEAPDYVKYVETLTRIESGPVDDTFMGQTNMATGEVVLDWEEFQNRRNREGFSEREATIELAALLIHEGKHNYDYLRGLVNGEGALDVYEQEAIVYMVQYKFLKEVKAPYRLLNAVPDYKMILECY